MGGGILLNLKYFALLLTSARKGIEIDRVMRKQNIMDNEELTPIYDCCKYQEDQSLAVMSPVSTPFA